jgi:hypothetical protein
MSLAKYEVICEGPQGKSTYWDGVSLQPKGTIVELDTDVVKVSKDSHALKPVGNSPVYEKKGEEVTEWVVAKHKADPQPALTTRVVSTPVVEPATHPTQPTLNPQTHPTNHPVKGGPTK